MTGFARASGQSTLGELTWEARTVNHRFLEVSMRLPEEFRVLEPKIREAVAARVKRGKVELGLRYSLPQGEGNALVVNEALIERLREAAVRAGELWPGGLAQPSLMELLRYPDVLQEQARDFEPLHAQALDTLTSLLENLVANRAEEGGRLSAMLAERCDGISVLVAEVRGHLPELRAVILERMRQRLAALDVEADEGRLEQELAILAQKSDVAEELDRLDSHVVEARNALERDEPVGRRLDFLMQEFNREANTLGSKSQDSACTRASLEMKVLIEQMREQVQNVE